MHFEFRSTYNESDLVRFAYYDLCLRTDVPREQKRNLAIAKDLLKEGSALEFVAKITKLPLQKVIELQSEPDDNE